MSKRFVPTHQRLLSHSFSLPDGTYIRWEDATDEALRKREEWSSVSETARERAKTPRMAEARERVKQAKAAKQAETKD